MPLLPFKGVMNDQFVQTDALSADEKLNNGVLNSRNLSAETVGKTAEVMEKTAETTGETAEIAPRNPSDWKQKIRFDRSFYAKLILADKKEKEFYAAMATELLSYSKMRSVVGWQGVSFLSGRTRVAFVSFSGKTLRLYLALDPDDFSDGKYKAKNVGDVKSKSKTPALLKIKSEGALKNALKLIDIAAENVGAGEKNPYFAPVKAENFKTDSFNNLITRGLIRVLKSIPKSADPALKSGGEEQSEKTEKSGYNTVNGTFADGNPEKNSPERDVFIVIEKPRGENRANGAKNEKDVYFDTLASTSELLAKHHEYNDILNALAQGDGKIRLTEKLMLRSIDELWVTAIEDCLPALDVLIRKPARFISENEEVLPIELTRRINGRSVAHLCRHTDYITPAENGEVTPTKILNVFREDSILTYENKFLNTLINRLYVFVSRRFSVAEKLGADEKTQIFEFENDFEDDGGKACVKISVEYSQKNLKKAHKTVNGTGLWARVERLNDVISAYMNSSFVKSMDKNFVRPPIMRTNAILKNKYFRECLALWEFIESYDDAGYGITIDEKNKNVSQDCIKQVYALAAEHYLVFRRNFAECKNDESVEDLARYNRTEKPILRPETLTDESDFEEEFFDLKPDYSTCGKGESGGNGEKLLLAEKNADFSDDISLALAAALKADELMQNDGDFEIVAVKSFKAKLSAANDEVKSNFAAVANEFLAHGKVKMRISRKYAAFNAGRTVLARITVTERVLKLYLAHDRNKQESGETSAVKIRFEDTPALFKVSGSRTLKRALSAITELCGAMGLNKKDGCALSEVKPEDFPVMGEEEMLEKGLVTLALRKKSNFAAFSDRAKLSGAVDETVAAAENSVKRGNNDASAEPPFGSKINENVLKTAETLNKATVTESSALISAPDADFSSEDSGYKTPDEREEAELAAIAERIEKVARPIAEYDKPTEFGIDDSSGFMRFEEENEEKDK